MASAFRPEEMELREALKRQATNNPGSPGKNVSRSITIKGSNCNEVDEHLDISRKKPNPFNVVFFLFA